MSTIQVNDMSKRKSMNNAKHISIPSLGLSGILKSYQWDWHDDTYAIEIIDNVQGMRYVKWILSEDITIID